MPDPLVISGRTFESRLIVGTGKYRDVDETERAIDASGAEIVTVALRRIDVKDRSSGSLMALLKRKQWLVLPNTAGCYTADEAVRTLRLARELDIAPGSGSSGPMVKLEVIGDAQTLYPDNEQTLVAARSLVKEGFVVLPYCIDDPIVCRKLEDLGCAAVMPLAAPIGSGLGIRNPHNLEIILERARVPGHRRRRCRHRERRGRRDGARLPRRADEHRHRAGGQPRADGGGDARRRTGGAKRVSGGSHAEAASRQRLESDDGPRGPGGGGERRGRRGPRHRMILRSLVLVTLFASAASAITAPIQCGHDEDPALRKDESPADALWDLAAQFREAHDEAAAKKTLEYLVQRYPASRWAAAARDQLGAAQAGRSGDGG